MNGGIFCTFFAHAVVVDDAGTTKRVANGNGNWNVANRIKYPQPIISQNRTKVGFPLKIENAFANI